MKTWTLCFLFSDMILTKGFLPLCFHQKHLIDTKTHEFLPVLCTDNLDCPYGYACTRSLLVKTCTKVKPSYRPIPIPITRVTTPYTYAE